MDFVVFADAYYAHPFVASSLTRRVTTARLLAHLRRWLDTRNPIVMELGGAWKTNDFVEFMNPIYGWEEGYGMIGHSASGAAFPARINTSPPVSESGNFSVLQCYYFRIRFDFAGEPEGAMLQLRHIIDDGAVFYLNGQEFHRFNLLPGPVVCDTLASSNLGDAAIGGPFAIPATNLVTGMNVLAAEVHQNTVGSSDILFGAELKVVASSTRLDDHFPRLGIAQTNGWVRLDWTPPFYTLEQATAVTGAWGTVSGVVNNSFTTEVTNAARFFRLRQ